jgi:putative membrane protein
MAKEASAHGLPLWATVCVLKSFLSGNKETPMTPIIRRTFLVAVAVAPILHVASVHAVDALPDARFVGFAETVNDFEIKSGQLALAKSSNEHVRAFATRAIAEYTTNAQYLTRNRNEANVTMAPDENVRKIADDAMARLNSLQGAEFDTAYADAQLRVQTAAVAQYGAFSQNGNDGSLRRHAERSLPQVQSLLEDAKKLAGSR